MNPQNRSGAGRWSLPLVSALVVVTLVVTMFMSWQAWKTSLDLRAVARANRDIITKTSRLLQSLVDAETGQRGFLLTGEADYLEPYTRAARESRSQLEALWTTASAMPDQRPLVEKLKPLVEKKLKELSVTVELAKTQGIEAALVVVRTNEGRDAMEKIRAICREMGTSDDARILTLGNLAREKEKQRLTITVFENVLIALLLTLGVFTVRARNREREQFIEELRNGEELKREIAERRKSEEAAALLSSIVANSEEAIVSLTLDGVITSWNRGTKAMFGYTPEEAIGKHIRLIFPPEHDSEEIPVLKGIQQGKPVEHFETERIHKDGRRIQVSITVSPIRNSTGDVVGVSAILRDIGRRKQAEERFRLVVESAPNAIVMINPAGQITLVNTRTEQWFGYTRQEMIGKPIEMLLPERFRNVHVAHRTGFFFKPAALGPSERTMGLGRELYARRKDGSEFPIEVGLNPMQTDEGPMVLSAIVDATGRKGVEENIREFNRLLETQVSERTLQLRKANKELEEFAYVASHDLKAPLRVIDNCSKWIAEDLEEYLSGDSRENMNLLRGRVKRMEKLLDDLLDYARIGKATDSRYNEAINGDKLMENILEMLAPEGFTVNVGPGFAGIHVRAMPLQLILMNLISNAIKHHDKKTGRIDVTAEDLGTMYAFAVKDDGPGIPPQFHAQVFKMFQTLRPRDQVEGSGMGLAMVRKHVEVAGGTMELESAEGKGSTFRFTWPKQERVKEELVAHNGHAIR